jgi:hypothetical protein
MVVINAPISAGSGVSNSNASPVTGCASASRAACSACRPEAPDFGKAVTRRRVRHLAASHRTAIDRIADHAMPEMRHMNTNLMRSPGFQPTFHKAGKGWQAADHAPVGGGKTAIFHNRLFFAVA